MTIEEILDEEFNHLERLECDGATRVLHYRLKLAGIEHTIYVGKVVVNSVAAIPLHYWIVLKNGNILDTKAGIWLRDSAPYGIFNPINYPEFCYIGSPEDIEVSPFLYNYLTRRTISIEHPFQPLS
jgi:hypothetical protein